MSEIGIKPFVKWAGGKSRLLEDIRKAYPTELGKGVNKYAEPFVGGGAVLFDILSNYILDAIYISDVNAELINAYCVIRDDAENLIYLLNKMQNEYILADDNKRKEFFYKSRESYNLIKASKRDADKIKKAALLIFLNKTCFNGLYRVNRNGQYNVPMGAYKNPCICDEVNLRNISDALKNVEIVWGDYRQSKDFIDDKTFVYFDPPYRPLTKTASFTSYSENLFDDKAQIELAQYVEYLDMIGAKVVVSNSDPKNINEKDDFFDDLYKKHIINRVEATRMINSKANGRGKIKELLIVNY